MRAVADVFDLGQIHAVTPVMRGAMGEITKVETHRGTYAVKELFSWNPGDGAEAEAELTHAAGRWGWPLRKRCVLVRASS